MSYTSSLQQLLCCLAPRPVVNCLVSALLLPCFPTSCELSRTTMSGNNLYQQPVLTKMWCIFFFREVGLRFHPTRGAMSMGKSKGGAAPDSTCEEEEHVLKDMAHLIKEYHDPSR